MPKYGLILFLMFPYSLQVLKMCDYLRLIGRTSQDCSLEEYITEESFDFDFSVGPTMSPLASIIFNIEKDESRRAQSLQNNHLRPSKDSKLKMCNGPEYKQCRHDHSCVSKYSCEGNFSPKRCCLHTSVNYVKPRLVPLCPKTADLGYVCQPQFYYTRTTSWCTTNEDCAKTSNQLCCDTGCGFNVCLQTNSIVHDNAIRFVSNNDCPDPDSMQMKCVSNYRKHTNWCRDDSECEVGRKVGQGKISTVRRLCCPTPCAYNTCINLASGVYSIGK